MRYKFLKILQPVVVCMQMFPGNEKIQASSLLFSIRTMGFSDFTCEDGLFTPFSCLKGPC